MDTHDLLADMDWLSRLAHRLVRDPALADDAVQEAWLAAKRRMTAGGSAEMPDRGLLGRTLRGMILHGRRGVQRRRFHESRAARGEALPSTEQLLLIGERQQTLWHHLRALDEPYRSTLLLRFQAGLGPAEIGARSGDKEDTVRWRIRRGLELLRDSLEADAEEGGRGAGLLGMVPVAVLRIHPSPIGAAPLGAAAHTTGVLWMTHKFLVTLSAAGLLLATAVYFLPGLLEPVDSRAAESTLAMDGPAGLLNSAEVLGVDGTGPSAASKKRSSIGGAPGDAAAAVELKECVATGRVVDGRGLPVQGARVVADVRKKWERETLTDAQGRFELACPLEPSVAMISVPAFEFYEKAWVALGSTDRCTFPSLTVARIDIGDSMLQDGSTIVGRIVDEVGRPVSDASVISSPLDRGVRPNENGEFRLEGLTPGANRLRIYVKQHRDVFQQLTLPAGRVLDVGTITLERGPQFHVRGRVVDEGGLPVPGAIVYTPREEVVAGVDGGFDFKPTGKHDAWLNASAVGYRESGTMRCADGAEVELVVREQGSLCRFQIVDGTTGQPLKGASMRVWEGEKCRTLTLASGSYRYGVRPGSSPARYDVEPIEAGVHINGSHVANEATRTIDIEFPCIPVEAQDLRLEIQPRDEEEDPRRTRLPFEAKLVAGERVRVELQ